MKTEVITLGQCSRKEQTLRKIEFWRPVWANSWALVGIKRYRRSVAPPSWSRNYYRVEVRYLSAKSPPG
jgi:hypothetical protein